MKTTIEQKMMGYGLSGAILMLLSIPAQAVTTRYPITAEEVAAAITNSGFKVAAPDVALPGVVYAASPTPTLRVRSTQSLSDNSTVVRVECESGRECLPFYARVRTSPAENASLSQKISAQPHANLAEAQSRRSGPMVRSGDPAVLLLEGDHVRIHIPVVCVESGDRGARIRVRSAANRQIYTAEVVDVAVLKGSL